MFAPLSLATVTPSAMTRAEEVEYARRHGLPIGEEHKKYSIDDNLWSRSIEGGPLDDPREEPPEDAFKWTVAPEKAPNEPAYLTLEFEKGLPVAVNGEKMPLDKLVAELNHLAGAHGVGRIDHIENRLVGFKSREVYEAPAAVVLYHAHVDLEKLVLTPRELRFKHHVLDPQWADLVYQGLFVEPLREALEAAAEAMDWRTSTTSTRRIGPFPAICRSIHGVRVPPLLPLDHLRRCGEAQRDSRKRGPGAGRL